MWWNSDTGETGEGDAPADDKGEEDTETLLKRIGENINRHNRNKQLYNNI